MDKICMKCMSATGVHDVKLHVRKKQGDKPFVTASRGWVCDPCKDSISVQDVVEKDSWGWKSLSENVRKRIGFTPRYDATTLGFY